MKRALLLSLAAAGAACQDSVPVPSALLERPSGVAYVARTSSTGAFPRRADVFIADSEAQGIRVLQLIQIQDEMGQVFDSQAFVPAPALFFPLLVPAEGFPTALAASRDGQRLFALAPATRRLHVLDIGEVPYGADSTAPHNVPLAEIPLDELGGAFGVPSAIATLGVNGGNDYVLIAFDGGPEAPSSLVALVIGPGEGGELMRLREDAIEVADSPRDLLVRDGAVLATSAASVFVTVATATASASGDIFTGVQLVLAGAPTTKLIDVPRQGVLALALDRPAAILLEESGGTYARSTRRFVSPFTPEDERDSDDALGRFDLRALPVAGGAAGRAVTPLIAAPVPSGQTEQVFVTLFQGEDDLVAISHSDGQASMLGGTPLELELLTVTGVIAAYEQNTSDLVIEAGACVQQPQSCGTPAVSPDCDAAVLGFTDTSPRTIRATYRGTLLGSRTGTITALGGGSYALTDESISAPLAFTERPVRAGDQLLLQLDVPARCTGTSTGSIELSVTATTATITADRVLFALDAPPPALDCDAGATLPVRVWEIYPGEDEVVLARVFGRAILEVYGRFPVEHDADEDRVSLTGEVRMTLSSDDRFSCTLEPGGGVPCFNNNDCGGAICEIPAGQCSGRCPITCGEGSTGCLTRELVRRCTALELSTTAASPALLDFTAEPPSSAPDTTIFVPLHRGFMTSFPGARQLVETYQEPDGTFSSRIIR